MGYCPGIENYSRHLSGRGEGEPPATLLNYFRQPFLTIVDESHVTLPQLRAMYNGDQSRKRTLVDYGFRLPSAKDNRPLNFEEFLRTVTQIVFTTATPGPYELGVSSSRRSFVRPDLSTPRSRFVSGARLTMLVEEVRHRVGTSGCS